MVGFFRLIAGIFISLIWCIYYLTSLTELTLGYSILLLFFMLLFTAIFIGFMLYTYYEIPFGSYKKSGVYNIFYDFYLDEEEEVRDEKSIKGFKIYAIGYSVFFILINIIGLLIVLYRSIF